MVAGAHMDLDIFMKDLDIFMISLIIVPVVTIYCAIGVFFDCCLPSCSGEDQFHIFMACLLFWPLIALLFAIAGLVMVIKKLICLLILKW